MEHTPAGHNHAIPAVIGAYAYKQKHLDREVLADTAPGAPSSTPGNCCDQSTVTRGNSWRGRPALTWCPSSARTTQHYNGMPCVQARGAPRRWRRCPAHR